MLEALIAQQLIDPDLADPDLADPDLDHQHLTPGRALRELERVRAQVLHADGHDIHLVTRPSPLQARILTALGVDTTNWDRAHIT